MEVLNYIIKCIRSKIEDGYGKLKINGIVKTENGFKVEIEGSNWYT